MTWNLSAKSKRTVAAWKNKADELHFRVRLTRWVLHHARRMASSKTEEMVCFGRIKLARIVHQFLEGVRGFVGSIPMLHA